MKKLIYWCGVIVLTCCWTFQSAHAVTRHFTCHANIQLQGAVGKTYAPSSWASSCQGTGCDREATCKGQIKSTWLNNGAIWGLLGLNLSEQNTICKAAGGSFRVDYGFDERSKAWNFTQQVGKSGCTCVYTCPTGYTLSGTSCTKLVCSNTGIGNVSFNGGLISGGNLYQSIGATKGNCKF